MNLRRFCFLIALALSAAIGAVVTPAERDLPTSDVPSLTSAADVAAAPEILPNRCAIVATEAAARLAKTGAWTRILFIHFIEPGTGELLGHAVVVWQPPTSTQNCVYDEAGTHDLNTSIREPGPIAAQLSKRLRKRIVAAKFLR